MANATNFNRKIDLITEREVVFDFLSRLSIGKDWIDPQYDTSTIFSANTNLKNILRQIAKALPTSAYLNLNTLSTTYVEVSEGDTTVSVQVLGEIMLAISERTGLDLTDCFLNGSSAVTSTTDTNGNAINSYTYTISLDVPYTNDDIIRVYAIGNPIS